MSKKMISVAVVVFVAACVVAAIMGQPYKKARTRFATETKEVIEAQYRTSRINGGTPSPELLAMTKRDPEFVMAFLIIEEVKHFPGVPDGLEQEILATAREEGSVAALVKVRQAIDNGLNKAIEEHGGLKGDKRVAWINNNPATGMLFLEWPIAERLGKKAEYVTSRLTGENQREEPYWFAPLTNEQMQGWWWGTWPFPGEKSPLE
jgi:type II secretory pathway pseudopilin PulG